MTNPAIPSLNSYIGEGAPAGVPGAGPTAAPPAPAGTLSLAPAVEPPAAGTTPTQPLAPTNVPVQPPVQAAPAQPAPQTPAAPAAPQSAIRAALESQGFEVPENLVTDEQVARHIAWQLDQSNSQEETRAPGMGGTSAASPQPGAQAPTSGASPPATTTPLRYNVSPEAQRLVDAGVLARGENGWQSTIQGIDPKYVSELNTQEAVRISNARRLTEQPLDFFKEAASELGLVDAESLKELREELTSLKESRQKETEAVENQMVDKWIDENRPHLFVNGDPNQGWTAYGSKYLDMEAKVKEWSGKANPLSRAEINRRTRQAMEDMGLTPQTMNAPAPQGAAAGTFQQPVSQPQPQPQPFAATLPAQPAGVVNTLPDYAAAAPAAAPAPILGKGGFPSLMAHIQADPNSLQ